VIDNYPADQREDCVFPVHPQKPELGTRTIAFARELWIEADDFMENAPPDYFRLALGSGGAPGQAVRLRHAYVVRATAVEQDAAGKGGTAPAEDRPGPRAGPARAHTAQTKGP